MSDYVLEVCVDSVESAIAAEKGGATRLELCANLVIGGTTPSPVLFEAVREAVELPINVLIRPRFGDFLYTNAECNIMQREIAQFASLGAHAVVVGALRADGSLDREVMSDLIAAAGDLRVTMHRAFDVCADPLSVMEEALELGVDTILTSGQKANARAGRELIGTLIEKAGKRADIMIGGGVDHGVVGEFLEDFPGIRAFHLSGKTVLDSGMRYRNREVSMGLPGISEFQIWRTCEESIRLAREVLDRHRYMNR